MLKSIFSFRHRGFFSARGLSAAVLSVLSAFAVACASTPEPPPNAAWPASPPFVEISGGAGARIYLFGTIHFGPKQGWVFPKAVRDAIAASRTVVMEADIRALNEEVASDVLLRYALLPGTTPLSTIISEETAALIADNDLALARDGMSKLVREAVKPWYIAVSMTQASVFRTVYRPEQSADNAVLAGLGEREFMSLESPDEAFALFDGLSLDIQEAILRDTITRMEEAPADLEVLATAWRNNDEAKLLEFAREGEAEMPELKPFYDVLLDERNLNWLPTFVSLLESSSRAGSSAFIAVNALHLVGEGSLVDLLKNAGYEVRSIAPPLSAATSRAAAGAKGLQ